MYDPELKKDLSLIMVAIGCIARDITERIVPDIGDEIDRLDREKHKVIALIEIDESLLERSDQLLAESQQETVPGVKH